MLDIRPATRAGLDTMVEWAAAEGWNPGRDDAEAFYAADPGGFLIGYAGAEPVACISVVAYGKRYGFLGFYICRPEYRSKGNGLALWQAGMVRLGDRVIGLDGVVAQQENYVRSGFALAHRNIRFAGRASAHETAGPRIVELRPGHPPGMHGVVIAYDRAFFPAPRETFVRQWVGGSGRRTIAFVEDNEIRGCGCIRPARTGYRIGPLFADNPGIADRLFGALTARLRGEEICLDLPEPNGEALALAERHGLAPVFETARMYRGNAPFLPLERIFGITTFELG